jgi:hypothetical protein
MMTTYSSVFRKFAIPFCSIPRDHGGQHCASWHSGHRSSRATTLPVEGVADRVDSQAIYPRAMDQRSNGNVVEPLGRQAVRPVLGPRRGTERRGIRYHPDSLWRHALPAAGSHRSARGYERVRFDFSNTVWNEDVDPATAFTQNAKTSLFGRAQAVEKVVVLTEGKAESGILHASLERLYPHLKRMYSVLDHSAFKAQGGTGELERLARGFAGAGISNRTVVLFDNDTAGVAAAQDACHGTRSVCIWVMPPGGVLLEFPRGIVKMFL